VKSSALAAAAEKANDNDIAKNQIGQCMKNPHQESLMIPDGDLKFNAVFIPGRAPAPQPMIFAWEESHDEHHHYRL
jgi:hypothetical protein